MEILSLKIYLLEKVEDKSLIKLEIENEKILFWISKILAFLKIKFEINFLKEVLKNKFILIEGILVQKFNFKIAIKIK